MTATNICYNFVGFRYSSPLKGGGGGIRGQNHETQKKFIFKRIQNTVPNNL